jgi:cytochrome c551/c552
MNTLIKLIIGGVVFFLLVQLVPYGRNHSNPPVKGEPKWDSTATRDIVKRACFNCHSNETVWPFYSRIAPASWLVYRDVVKARAKLNFSEWQGGKGDAENPGMIESMVMSDEMPPFQYRLAHPEARLKPDERKRLVEGIKASLNSK